MRFFCFFLICLLSTSLSAQRRGNPALAEDVPLQLQFDTLLVVSNGYREQDRRFEVVPEEYLKSFMRNVSDSISGYTVRIDELEGQMATLEATIEETSSEVEDRDETIAELNKDRDSITVLGLQLDKDTYNLIVWALVIGLFVALLVALASTRIAASNNTELKRERDKLADELEQSRKSRLTVEQELRRQLQDEINRRRG